MKSRRYRFLLAVLGFGCGIFTWHTFRPKEARSVNASAPVPSKSEPASETSRFTEDLSVEYLQGYASENSTPEKDLEQVKDVVDAFVRSVKIPGALPTGSNRELVAALAGENAYRIRLLDPAAGHLNADGELVDRWQVPLFFHFVEGNDVGVRSAGPDRVMWTADDVLMGEHALAE